MPSTDLRAHVKNIRSDARALLARLREERMAKSRFARKPEDTVMPAITTLQPSSVLTLPSETIVPSRRFQTNLATAMQENALAPILSGGKMSDLATSVLSIDVVTAIEPLPAKKKKGKSASWKQSFVSVPEILVESEPPNASTTLANISAEPVMNYEKTSTDQVLPPPKVTAVAIAEFKSTDRRPKRTTTVGEKPVKASPAIDATQPEHTVVDKKTVIIEKLAKKLPASSALIPSKKPYSTARPEITLSVPCEPNDEPACQQSLIPIKTVTRHPEGFASLANVPTLGPGMIWRLNQLGLETLHDLADVEAGHLRAALGPVGRLVKIEDWILYARQIASA